MQVQCDWIALCVHVCVRVYKRARLRESEWETGVIQYTFLWASGGGAERQSGK